MKIIKYLFLGIFAISIMFGAFKLVEYMGITLNDKDWYQLIRVSIMTLLISLIGSNIERK